MKKGCAYVYAFLCACMYVCMYVCMYACIIYHYILHAYEESIRAYTSVCIGKFTIHTYKYIQTHTGVCVCLCMKECIHIPDKSHFQGLRTNRRCLGDTGWKPTYKYHVAMGVHIWCVSGCTYKYMMWQAAYHARVCLDQNHARV